MAHNILTDGEGPVGSRIVGHTGTSAETALWVMGTYATGPERYPLLTDTISSASFASPGTPSIAGLLFRLR